MVLLFPEGDPFKRRLIEVDPNPKIEIDGIHVELVCSNVRQQSINWSATHLVSGMGHEGNLVIVESLSDIGSTTHVENQKGIDEPIRLGKKFIAVLANRHSGTSESGGIPAEGIAIQEGMELHLLSTGGIVGINTGIPLRMHQEPLRLKALGLVAHEGRPLDLLELAGPHAETLSPSAPIVLVCGTSAEVGKTTTSKGLIRVLDSSNIAVAATKFSGTGRKRDINNLRAAGAQTALDFPDAGLPTTYTSADRFRTGTYTLFNRINAAQPQIIIAEAGGDPIEANVPTFLSDPNLMRSVIGVVIVAGDVMGMMGAADYIRQFQPNVPLFVTDPKDRNQTATRERVRHVLPGVHIFNSLNDDEIRHTLNLLLKGS